LEAVGDSDTWHIVGEGVSDGWHIDGEGVSDGPHIDGDGDSVKHIDGDGEQDSSTGGGCPSATTLAVTMSRKKIVEIIQLLNVILPFFIID